LDFNCRKLENLLESLD